MLTMAPKAVPTLDQCLRAMAVVEKKRAKHRAALAQLNAQHRAWAERARAVRQRLARTHIREKLVAKGGGGEQKVKKKLGRGRPERWPGLCYACMMRHFKEAGGPGHRRSLCQKTEKYIKTLGD